MDFRKAPKRRLAMMVVSSKRGMTDALAQLPQYCSVIVAAFAQDRCVHFIELNFPFSS